MTDAVIRPSDIKSPSELSTSTSLIPEHHLYTDSLGKYQYEIIAQKILEVSQQRGEWVSLTYADFVPPFENMEQAIGWLEQMAWESRHLNKKGKRFELGKTAKKALFEEYPSTK